jgi:anti-sigma factor RsiW
MDKELETSLAAQMEKHRQECPACARHLRQLQRAEETLARALSKPPPSDYSWAAAELMVRQAFARQTPVSVRGSAMPTIAIGLRRLFWPLTPAWRGLAVLWLMTAAVHLLAQITDAKSPAPVIAATSFNSEFAAGQILKMEKILANTDAEEPHPVVKTPPSPQGALWPLSQFHCS